MCEEIKMKALECKFPRKTYNRNGDEQIFFDI